MPYTLSNLFTDIENRLVDTTGGTVTRAMLVRLINSHLRRARRVFDLPSTERVSQISLFNDMETYSAPTGYKELVGIYDDYRMNDILNFKRVDEFDFWRNLPGGDNTIAEARDGNRRYLLVRFIQSNVTNAMVHNCDTFDGNGTWTANTTTSDAASVASDTIYVRQGSGSVKFNITVAQSSNNYAEISNSTMTAVDLNSSALDQVGVMFAWVYLPSSTAYTNFLMRWGSDSTNYYESTVTTQYNGGAFVQGWNILGFDWSTATTTGTPTDTAIDYLLFRATYAATMTNQTGLRLDWIIMRQRYIANLHYHSDYLVLDDDGTTYKESFDDQNDTSSQLMMDASHVDWITSSVLEEVFTHYIKDPDARALHTNYRMEAEAEIERRFPSRREIPTKTYQELDNVGDAQL